MRRLAFVGLLAACSTESNGDDGSNVDTTAADTAAVTDVSYAACDDPEQGCQDADCRERTVDGADWLVCIPPCETSADCPTPEGSNAGLVCDGDSRCALECTPGVAVCPSGMNCIPGEPAQCMWPVDPGVADLDALCVAACEGCGAAMLLGWTTDCLNDCAADMSDCDEAELSEALLCPGDASCYVGGLALNNCLDALSCKD